MNPSRELDALIAEKVMGFTYATTVNFRHEGKEETGVTMTKGATFILPPYSTEISAAWEVMEKLISKYDVEINHLIYHGMGDPKGWFIKLNGDRIGFPHETLPHEICLAALKAVGYENKS